ncbi:YxiG-like protein [Micromonospora chersina]|uniref:YxiG-like protein n=1 Tax=Micromonospora chersina TaxID=47854 RepID=UPI003F4BB35D
MEITQLSRDLDDVFDQAVLYHAFTDYMRDYEAIVYVPAAPSTRVGDPEKKAHRFDPSTRCSAGGTRSPAWKAGRPLECR